MTLAFFLNNFQRENGGVSKLFEFFSVSDTQYFLKLYLYFLFVFVEQ